MSSEEFNYSEIQSEVELSEELRKELFLEEQEEEESLDVVDRAKKVLNSVDVNNPDFEAMLEVLEGLSPEQLKTIIDLSWKMGNDAFRNKSYSDAVMYYTQVVVADPNNATVWVNLSFAHYKIGDFGKSLKDANIALRIKETAKAFYRRGQALYELFRTNQSISQLINESISAFDKGLKLEPQNNDIKRARIIAINAKEQVEATLGSIMHSESQMADPNAPIPDQKPIVLTRPEILATPGFDPTYMFKNINMQNSWYQSSEIAKALHRYLQSYTELLAPRDQLVWVENPTLVQPFVEALDDITESLEDWKILHLGTVFGVLPSISAQLGASCVYAVEESGFLARIVRSVITKERAKVLDVDEENIFGPISVRNCKFNELFIRGEPLESLGIKRPHPDTILNERVNVVLSTRFDYSLLNLGIIPGIKHAREHLVTEDFVTMPYSATVYAALVDLGTHNIAGFDLSPLNKLRWSPIAEEVFLHEELHTMLSDPVPVLQLNFMSEEVFHPTKHEVEFRIRNDVSVGSVCNGIVFWFDLHLTADGQHHFTTSPFVDYDPCPADIRITHIRVPIRASMGQAMQYWGDVHVSPSSTLRVAVHNTTLRISFEPLQLNDTQIVPFEGRSELLGGVPRWHFSMLADSTRNGAYDAAIRMVIEKVRNDRIRTGASEEEINAPVKFLDIGTGTGLLALMAARAGGLVWGCESLKVMANVARRCVKLNGHSDRITIARKDLRQMKVEGEYLPHSPTAPNLSDIESEDDDDEQAKSETKSAEKVVVDPNSSEISTTEEKEKELGSKQEKKRKSQKLKRKKKIDRSLLPGRVDVLLFEMFDYGCFGEGVLHLLSFARQYLLRPGGEFVPNGATIWAALADIRYGRVCDVDVSIANAYRWDSDYFGLNMRRTSHKMITEPFKICDVSFATATIAPFQHRFTVRAKEEGVVTAAVFWFDLDFGSGEHGQPLVITSSPLDISPEDNPAQQTSHWLQAVQVLHPLQVQKNVEFDIIAGHDSVSVKFAWPENIELSIKRQEAIMIARERGEAIYDYEEEDLGYKPTKSVPYMDNGWNSAQESVVETYKKMMEMITTTQGDLTSFVEAAGRISAHPAAFEVSPKISSFTLQGFHAQ